MDCRRSAARSTTIDGMIRPNTFLRCPGQHRGLSTGFRILAAAHPASDARPVLLAAATVPGSSLQCRRIGFYTAEFSDQLS